MDLNIVRTMFTSRLTSVYKAYIDQLYLLHCDLLLLS